MSGPQRDEFERTLECNFGFDAEGIGRFRFNVYRQRGETAVCDLKSDRGNCR